MLLDSNVIIYAAKPEHAALREFIADHAPAVSIISRIEVRNVPNLIGTLETLLRGVFCQPCPMRSEPEGRGVLLLGMQCPTLALVAKQPRNGNLSFDGDRA